jgi:hypothetical protein
MSATAVPVETVTRFTPVGIRLWDFVTQRVVSDGMTVAVEGEPLAQVTVNRHGVFAVSNLTGLRAREFGETDDVGGSPPTTVATDIRVSVDDQNGWFLPFSFTVSAPTDEVAAFTCPETSPPEIAPAEGRWVQLNTPLPAIPLFSACTRPIPAGLGVVRAQLWCVDPTSSPLTVRPAAGALLDVFAQGLVATVTGIADKCGRVVVALPYPPAPIGFRSPPSRASLANQAWPIAVSVRYSQGAVSDPDYPDLCSLLRQPKATLDPVVSTSLSYGLDLNLEAASGEPLLVQPAGAA